MKLQVTGTRAVLILIAAAAFVGWRATTAYTDLDAGATEELTQWLRAEYAREQLRATSTSGDITAANVESLLATQNVSISSVKARGGPDDMVVRIEVVVDGRTPPDGQNVRYYRMSHSSITGWHMQRETNAYDFHTTLF